MKAWIQAGVLAGAVMLSAHAAPPKGNDAGKRAVQPVAKGDADAGRIKSESERCQECHGIDGNGNGVDGKFAKLAGQYPEYILKQIRNFRSGERKHDFMSMMAKSVDDADVIDIAAYYARQEKMYGTGAADDAIAKKLFLNGDAARNIAPCIECHGESGKGNGNVLFPVIGGQEARYLEKQLLDWRSGERRNSAGGVMNTTAKELTDAEILALVHYLSGL